MGKRNKKRKAGADGVDGEDGSGGSGAAKVGISFSADKSLDAKIKADAEAKAAAAKATPATAATAATATAAAAAAASPSVVKVDSKATSTPTAESDDGLNILKKLKTGAAPARGSLATGRITFGANSKQPDPATAAAAAASSSAAAMGDGDGDGAGGGGRPGARSRSKKKEKQSAKRVKGRDYSELNDEEKTVTWERHRKAGDPISSKFVEYYKAQNLLSSDAEWKQFIDVLQEPLPITFRLSAITLNKQPLIARLKTSCAAFFTPSANGEVKHDSAGHAITITPPGFRSRQVTIDAPKPLSWYPDQMGWYFKISKKDLRSVKEINTFKEFLTLENEQGNLNRQEAVSMIPPLLLNAQPHHMVLDMCAAPGSKTAQLLEALHQDPNVSPTGMVIANDADEKRARLLVHQTARYKSTAFCITNHPAQFLPNMYCLTPYGKAQYADPEVAKIAAAKEQELAQQKASHVKFTAAAPKALTPFEAKVDALAASSDGKTDHYLWFDRILCDVPCSGDGTLRKNPNLWSEWDTNMGNGLHVLQLQIAMRAARLLRIGAEMVYSTCSFNPIENEAVVAEVLRRCDGGLELVDVSDRLPGLIRSPGISTWKVASNKSTAWFNSWKEVPKNTRSIKPSFFPPTAEEVKRFHLDRCIRMLPHTQDTGGFFVALLRKTKLVNTKSLSWSTTVDAERAAEAVTATGAAAAASSSAPAPVASQLTGDDDDYLDDYAEPEGTGPDGGKARRGSRKMKYNVEKDADALVPLNQPKLATALREFYGLKPEFRDEYLFVRSEGTKKVYVLAPAVGDLLSYERNARLRIVHSGQRVFERMDDKSRALVCQYRLCQDGVSEILPFMTKQIGRASLDDFMSLLATGSVLLDDFTDSKFIMQLREAQEGGMAIILESKEAASISPRPIVVVCFRTFCSLNTLMSKLERTSYQKLLQSLLPKSATAAAPATSSVTAATAAAPAAAAAAAK